MNVHDTILEMATKARAAAAGLAKKTTDEKNAALLAIADSLEKNRAAIVAANGIDLAHAKEAGISPSMLDRLTLTPARFDAMVAGVRHVATLPDPVGETIWTRERPSGINIRKVRVVELKSMNSTMLTQYLQNLRSRQTAATMLSTPYVGSTTPMAPRQNFGRGAMGRYPAMGGYGGYGGYPGPMGGYGGYPGAGGAGVYPRTRGF